LTAVSGIQSAVDDGGRLVVRAELGFGFDFTGRPPTSPDVSGLTGTSQPTLSGRYEGSNRNVEFEFLGSGTIGVTPNLRVEARDQVTGESLGVFEIGQGYAPGDLIELPDGIAVALSVGDVVATETFTAPFISTADETGAMLRLGMNTLFSGSNASDLTIHPELLADRSRLAASLSGEPGDSANLIAMTRRRFEPVISGGTETMDDLLFTATATIGHETNALEMEAEGLSLVGEQLFIERESVEGVDPNEEMVEMLKYQRSFEAAARFVSAVNQTLEELMGIIR
jgi:flagellin-like hook-associated protein FlgL